MLKLIPDIDKKFILSKLSQEEIFERYLGVRVTFTGKVCSPLREDSNPTCTFKQYRNGKIIFKDWGGHFEGNCIDVVMRIFNLGYWDACRKIAEDFNLVKDGRAGKKYNKQPKQVEREVKDKSKIQVMWRKYEDEDLAFWGSFGIQLPTLRKYQAGVVKHAWVNDALSYSYRKDDVCFGYYFSKHDFKLYFPMRDEWRFIGNYTGLQGYEQLPATGDVLVITKSLKDVMFLYQMGIAAVAPASESSILTEEQYIELKGRFKQLVCLYDFDLTGLRSANKMKRVYGIPRVFLTNGRFGFPNHGSKDITDYAKKNSRNKAEELLMKLLCQTIGLFEITKTCTA